MTAHLIDQIAESQRILRNAIESVPKTLMRKRSAAGGFAIVEHAWHLADLEEEGWAVRLRRTLHETDPRLADFRGDAIAEERRYIEREVEPAVGRFAATRTANVALLRSLGPEDWSRPAVQEHVGGVTVASLASAMLSHDVAHANEIVALLRELDLRVPETLVSLAGLEPLARSA